MTLADKIYKILMNMGHVCGCHQRSDRSFHIGSRQFPICARCTGIFVGECLALVCFRIIAVPVLLLCSFCAIMFLDWFIQYLGLKESSNRRRFITGSLCGYALSTFFLKALVLIKQTITALQ